MSGSTVPTRLSAIQPVVTPRMDALILAARRWRELEGEDLILRLPLLDILQGVWIIGLPSPAWEAELVRLRGSLLAAGKDVPPLAGRVMEPGSKPPAAAPAPAAPPANADAGRRLRWIMEQMCGEEES